MRARFPVGMTFSRKRFPKAKELTEYTVRDILTTTNSKGDIVRLEYVITHAFMGQEIAETVVDPTIARCLNNEQLQQFL